MKKTGLVLATVFAMVLLPAVFSSAEEPGMGMMKEEGKAGMMQMHHMGKGKKGMMGSMHGMMMKSMMEKSMVATSDGGVIVLSGNKLTKYDKNLNVVKEVEIAVDMEGAQKQMMQMMEKFPMMGKGMMGEGDAAPAAAEAAAEEPAQEGADHESHH